CGIIPYHDGIFFCTPFMYQFAAMPVTYLQPAAICRCYKAIASLCPLQYNIWSLLLVHAKETPVYPSSCIFQYGGCYFSTVLLQYSYAFPIHMRKRVCITDHHFSNTLRYQPVSARGCFTKMRTGLQAYIHSAMRYKVPVLFRY